VNVAIAAVAAAGAFLLVIGPRRHHIVERISDYLRPRRPTEVRAVEPGPDPAARAGLTWTPVETRMRRAAVAAAGALGGILAAQGHLFIAGPGRSLPALAALGAVAGWLGFGMYLSTRSEQRSRALRFELPVVADSLALHVIAGESVTTAVERYVGSSRGVAAAELEQAMDHHRAGAGVEESLQRAVRRSADPAAGRLYSLLAHAHGTGGRLADTLTELAADYRAGLARDLTAEGGRRSLATYGPILALMVPVTLLFLLYPTLVGLRSLAAGP
jgi:tight adherence protein C